MTTPTVISQYRFVSQQPAAAQQSEPRQQETDEEIIARLRDKFEILELMTRAVKQGSVRAMIVSGAPGVGKSFGVESVLGEYETYAALSGNMKLKKFEVIKGSMTALGLYAKLYEYREPGNVVVFDDCDDVLFDDLSLNILKAALDSGRKRTISWNSDSRLLRTNDIPNSFNFSGGAIFITNVNFSNIKSKKLQDHLAALESRCHYIDLTIHTDREKLLRIQQLVQDGMIDEYGFSEEQKAEVIEFITTHKGRLRELSLRTVLKLCDLVKSWPDNGWKRFANTTLLRS